MSKKEESEEEDKLISEYPLPKKCLKNKDDSADPVVVDCTIADVCPGWDKHVWKLGFYDFKRGSTKGKFTCRPCIPSQEAWVAVDYLTGDKQMIGVSVCSSGLVDVAREPTMWLVGGFMWILGLLFVWNSFCRRRRQNKCYDSDSDDWEE